MMTYQAIIVLPFIMKNVGHYVFVIYFNWGFLPSTYDREYITYATFSLIYNMSPDFHGLFLVDTKSTKVGQNSRGFLELSTAVRLGWV